MNTSETYFGEIHVENCYIDKTVVLIRFKDPPLQEWTVRGENMYDELNYTSIAKHKHEPWFYVMSQSKVLIHQHKKVSTDSSN